MAAKEDYERIAVVTGADKGIGLETVQQLAAAGVTVVLTARDEGKGVEAASKLHSMGLSNVVFHQLDVTNSNSINLLSHFIGAKFGRLDILVNNAAVTGVEVDEVKLRALKVDTTTWLSGKAAHLVEGVVKTTYEKAMECINTNYYGSKRVTEALLPWLKLSNTGARIVNVSSIRGKLCRIPNDEVKNEFANVEKLTEERIDEILKDFMQDVKQDALIKNGWPSMVPAYCISKTALNAYTRLLAWKYPRMYINCVHPGYVDTDLTFHRGTMSVEEGAKGPFKLALLPSGSPTGCYFDQTVLDDF